MSQQFEPTEKQNIIRAHNPKRKRLFVVNAYAGCAKTSTSIEWVIIQCLRFAMRILIIMFNNAPAEEYRQKLEDAGVPPSTAKVRTYHGLCTEYAAKLLPDSQVITIEADFEQHVRHVVFLQRQVDPYLQRIQLPSSYGAWKRLFKGFAKFCHSEDVTPTMKHFDSYTNPKEWEHLSPQERERALSVWKCTHVQPLVFWCAHLWKWTMNGTLHFSFDSVVKWFSYTQDVRSISLGKEYDAVVVDEAQDLFPAVCRIIERQTWSIYLTGDRRQQLNGWNGTRDEMTRYVKFKNAEEVTLNQSFRFGYNIAYIVNRLFQMFGDPMTDALQGASYRTDIQPNTSVCKDLPFLSLRWSVQDYQAESKQHEEKLQIWRAPFVENAQFVPPIDVILARSNCTLLVLYLAYICMLQAAKQQEEQEPGVSSHFPPYELVPSPALLGYMKDMLEIYANPTDAVLELEESDHENAVFILDFVRTLGEQGHRLLKDAFEVGTMDQQKSSAKYRIPIMSVHAAKGLERARVYLCDDLDFDKSKFVYEEKHQEVPTSIVCTKAFQSIVYVAATRERNVLYAPAIMCELFLALEKEMLYFQEKCPSDSS